MKTNRQLTNEFFEKKEAQQKAEAGINKKIEAKIIGKYNNGNHQPLTLKDKVVVELNKLNK